MADRMVLGKHPTLAEYGLWMSKPGQNVLTADQENMLIDSSRFAARLYASGFVPEGAVLPYLYTAYIQNEGSTTLNNNHIGFYGVRIFHGLGVVPVFHISGKRVTPHRCNNLYFEIGRTGLYKTIHPTTGAVTAGPNETIINPSGGYEFAWSIYSLKWSDF